jgi:hypothetical protein
MTNQEAMASDGLIDKIKHVSGKCPDAGKHQAGGLVFGSMSYVLGMKRCSMVTPLNRYFDTILVIILLFCHFFQKQFFLPRSLPWNNPNPTP